MKANGEGDLQHCISVNSGLHVCHENSTKHKNRLCERNAQLLNVKAGRDIQRSHCSEKVSMDKEATWAEAKEFALYNWPPSKKTSAAKNKK